MIAGRSAVNQLSTYGTARATVPGAPLNEAELRNTQEHADLLSPVCTQARD